MTPRPRTGRRLGPFACVVALALIVASSFLQGHNRPSDSGEGLAMIATFAFFAIVGAVIVFKHSSNAVGWSFLAIAFFAGLTGFASEYALYVGRITGFETAAVRFWAWLANWTWWVPVVLIPTLPVLLFPDGRPPSDRWRWAVYLGLAALAVGVVGFATQSDSIEIGGDGPVVPSLVPTTFLQPVSEVLSMLAFPLALTAAAVSIASLIVRFRRSRGIERQQLKWVAYAASVMTTFFLVGALVEVVGGNDLVFVAAVTPVPMAAAVAILRYRLYDIDVIINRTLVYGALTAILAAAYFGLVVVFQRALSPVTEQSDIAVAASTLAVAALFGPLRRRIQQFIDRRFYRSRYDAQETLEAFSARLRNEVELDHLRSDLLGVVGATMRPRHASLWLREAG